MATNIRKLTQLTLREWVLLVQAFVCLPIVDLSLRLIGVSKTIQWFERAARTRFKNYSLTDAQSLARMVHVAGRRMPWRIRCLPQSVWVHRCLLRRGLASQLRFGVTSFNEGALAAHAWVELDGVPLDEHPLEGAEPAPFFDRASKLPIGNSSPGRSHSVSTMN